MSHDLYLPSGLRASRFPLTIVCGPPGAGKSTYVTSRRGPKDIVIDIDAMGGKAEGTRRPLSAGALASRISERNHRLRNLGLQSPDGRRAWFIVGAARPADRQAWADMLRPVAVVVLETPAEVCKRRIHGDALRAAVADAQAHAADAWWSSYRRRDGETVEVPPDD